MEVNVIIYLGQSPFITRFIVVCINTYFLLLLHLFSSFQIIFLHFWSLKLFHIVMKTLLLQVVWEEFAIFSVHFNFNVYEKETQMALEGYDELWFNIYFFITFSLYMWYDSFNIYKYIFYIYILNICKK